MTTLMIITAAAIGTAGLAMLFGAIVNLIMDYQDRKWELDHMRRKAENSLWKQIGRTIHKKGIKKADHKYTTSDPNYYTRF